VHALKQHQKAGSGYSVAGSQANKYMLHPSLIEHQNDPKTVYHNSEVDYGREKKSSSKNQSIVISDGPQDSSQEAMDKKFKLVPYEFNSQVSNKSAKF